MLLVLLVLVLLVLLVLVLLVLLLVLIEIICCNSFEKLVGVKFPIKEARLGTRTILFFFAAEKPFQSKHTPEIFFRARAELKLLIVEPIPSVSLL